MSMTGAHIALAATVVLAAATGLEAQVISDVPYAVDDSSYEAFVAESGARFPGPFDAEAFRRDHPREDWERLRSAADVVARSISYRVGSLRITGVIVRPRGHGRFPILVWARGGVGAARLDPPQMVEMSWWARRGYVVIASNYRGAGGSDGQDEFGGGDVEDIAALVPIARELPDVDPQHMFAIGFSRGGLMLLRAVAEGLPVRAFATAGAPTDIAEWSRSRPDIVELLQRMTPDYRTEAANRFCRRSAVCWPARISAPLLLAHGGNDAAVPPTQAWLLAQSLERARRRYQLVVFGEADHGLSGHRLDFFRSADALFSAQRMR